MPKCFHIVFRDGNPYLFKRIPLTISVARRRMLIRGKELFLEDILSSKSFGIRQLINDPDGYYVKDSCHYLDGQLKERIISLDNISLDSTGGGQIEKYHLDICKKQSDQAYVMYCPDASLKYKGQKLFILNPGQEEEIKSLGNLIKIAYKDGKILLNGEQGINVRYDHKWPSKMKVFA